MSERAYAAVAYIRVSTGEQRESGLGLLEAQRAAVTAEAERRGWGTRAGVRGCRRKREDAQGPARATGRP